MKLMVTPIVIGALGTIPKWLVKEREDLEIKWYVETIKTKMGQNTEKNPEDLRTLTLTPVENHQLMLVWNVLKVKCN